MLNIVKRRYLFFGLSLLVIIPGMIALLAWGFPLAIDFTGGSLLNVTFASGKAPDSSQIQAVYRQFGFDDSQVLTASGGNVSIQSRQMDQGTANQIAAAMTKQFNDQATVQRFDTVGPAVGQEVSTGATWAVVAAAIAILLYITLAFRRVQNAFRYGIAAVIAMLHDVAVVVGVEAIIAHLFNWRVDALFLTALLTVIGFSVHDTIVVFDRIRENANTNKRLPFETVVNHSIIQTLDRSINTQLTVLLTLLALALLGGETIRHFVIILLVGVFSGTYSSIFNAASILVVWENKEWRNWFRREPAEAV